MTRLKWNLVSVCLEIVLGWCKIGGRFAPFSTIGLEIILDAPVLLGDEAQVDARFIRFGDSANLDAR